VPNEAIVATTGVRSEKNNCPNTSAAAVPYSRKS
jgi:hypothetical protein